MGFYVPDSLSSYYVDNFKTETGTYKYDDALNEIGIEKQRAVQNLDKAYSDTINNAYSSYINSKHNLLSSNLGEGYKQAYIADRQAELAEQVNQADLSAAETKQNILNQAAQSEAAVGQAFAKEVSYMDRVKESLSNYFEYVKDLKQVINGEETGQSYLSDFDKTQDLSKLYDKMFSASPGETYRDAQGNAGMSYLDWAKANLGTKSEDTDWYDWLTYQGGYNQFKDMIYTSDMYKTQQENAEYNKTIADLYSKYNDMNTNELEHNINKIIEDNPNIKKPGDFMTEITKFLNTVGITFDELESIIPNASTDLRKVFESSNNKDRQTAFKILQYHIFNYLKDTNQLNYK